MGRIETLGVALMCAVGCGGSQTQGSVAPVDDSCIDCDVASDVAVVEEEAPAAPITGRPPIRMLAAGNQHNCALTEDGAVHCWGGNNRGQLGDGGEADESAVPMAVAGIPAMDAIWAGYEMTCGRASEGGQVHCWGETGLAEANPIAFEGAVSATLGPARGCLRNGAGELHCWGDYGRPHGPNWSELTEVPVDSVSAVSVSWLRGCAILANGRIRCWGQVPPYVAVDRQGEHWTYGRLQDVTQMVFADAPQVYPTIVGRRGRVFTTELGDPVSRSDSRKRLEKRPVEGLENVTQLVAGGGHHCARQEDGRAACWGLNSHGQVGAGSEEERVAAATFLSVTGIEQIVTGGGHSCARTASELYCWGANDRGQLGQEEPRQAPIPTLVPW